MEILNQTIVTVLSSIIVGGLTILVVQVFKYFRSKTKLINDESTRNIINNALDKLENIINTNIIAVDNTSKPIIIQSIADGKVTKEELNKLSEEVRVNVINQAGEDLINILNDSLGDINGLINSKIESQLAILKADPNIPVSKTEIK